MCYLVPDPFFIFVYSSLLCVFYTLDFFPTLFLSEVEYSIYRTMCVHSLFLSIEGEGFFIPPLVKHSSLNDIYSKLAIAGGSCFDSRTRPAPAWECWASTYFDFFSMSSLLRLVVIKSAFLYLTSDRFLIWSGPSRISLFSDHSCSSILGERLSSPLRGRIRHICGPFEPRWETVAYGLWNF